MNVLVGNIKIDPSYKKRLSRHQEDLKSLWKDKGTVEDKRKVLVDKINIINKFLDSLADFFKKIR